VDLIPKAPKARSLSPQDSLQMWRLSETAPAQRLRNWTQAVELGCIVDGIPSPRASQPAFGGGRRNPFTEKALRQRLMSENSLTMEFRTENSPSVQYEGHSDSLCLHGEYEAASYSRPLRPGPFASIIVPKPRRSTARLAASNMSASYQARPYIYSSCAEVLRTVA